MTVKSVSAANVHIFLRYIMVVRTASIDNMNKLHHCQSMCNVFDRNSRRGRHLAKNGTEQRLRRRRNGATNTRVIITKSLHFKDSTTPRNRTWFSAMRKHLRISFVLVGLVGSAWSLAAKRPFVSFVLETAKKSDLTLWQIMAEGQSPLLAPLPPASRCRRRTYVLPMLLSFFLFNVVPVIRQRVDTSQRGLLR